MEFVREIYNLIYLVNLVKNSWHFKIAPNSTNTNAHSLNTIRSLQSKFYLGFYVIMDLFMWLWEQFLVYKTHEAGD